MRAERRETQGVRIAPIALVTAVVLALGAGAASAAHYLLLAAIPITFVAGVALFGDFAAGESEAEDLDLMRLALIALALALVLIAATVSRLALVASLVAVAALALAAVLELGDRMPAPVLVVLRGGR
jgi:hypothetical protein